MRHSKPVRLGNRTYRAGESVYLFLDFTINLNMRDLVYHFKLRPLSVETALCGLAQGRQLRA